MFKELIALTEKARGRSVASPVAANNGNGAVKATGIDMRVAA